LIGEKTFKKWLTRFEEMFDELIGWLKSIDSHLESIDRKMDRKEKQK